MGLVVIHMENYHAEGTIELHDGLPTTSKLTADGRPDTLNHGFGTRSMRALAERYGGTLAVSADESVYRLDITLPNRKG